jgi:hypothetical protein
VLAIGYWLLAIGFWRFSRRHDSQVLVEDIGDTWAQVRVDRIANNDGPRANGQSPTASYPTSFFSNNHLKTLSSVMLCSISRRRPAF